MAAPRELIVIEGSYLKDILDQPAALQRSLEGFHLGDDLVRFAEEFRDGKYQRIVLTGMGSSLFSLYPLHLALLRTGASSLLMETAELIHYLPEVINPGTLIVAVSQSGETAEVLRLLEIAHDKAPVIGITNNGESPLAAKAQATILMRAGREATVSCKTYVCSVLALEWLRGLLAGDDAAKTKESLLLASYAIAPYVNSWRDHVAELAPLLDGVRHIFVTGRGNSISAALTSGLILKESTRFSAEGMSCAAFRHGPFEMLADAIFVVVMAGDRRTKDLNARLVADIVAARGRSVLVGSQEGTAALSIPQLPDEIRPIAEILPVQMISLVLAAQSGREAGRFELATKVTSVE